MSGKWIYVSGISLFSSWSWERLQFSPFSEVHSTSTRDPHYHRTAWECFIIYTLQGCIWAALLLSPSLLLQQHPPTPSWPQLPSSPHTLPRHLINVTHRLPSKTEGIVFVSSAADKAFWKADMHNDSAVIASLVWSPFLSVPHAACCCLTE